MTFSATAPKLILLLGVPIGLLLWPITAPSLKSTASSSSVPTAKPAPPAALSVVLSPHEGSEPVDEQIRRTQQRAASGASKEAAILKLGRLFIAKARLSNDPGFYKLAEQCAVHIETYQPENADALLLRGHALVSMHRFGDAEAIARRLVASREQVLDHALLGDALMEQGRLDEAELAYQRMADLKPCLQSYSRIAHFRWLKGDLQGAIEAMEEAIESGSLRDPEPIAWSSVRLANYLLQNGDTVSAERANARAIALVKDYAPALLQRGRAKLSAGDAAGAIESLQLACEKNPLPEYQWALAEALHVGEEHERAAIVEQQIQAKGAVEDPRTLSLYLATKGARPEEALRLAERELANRCDVFTYDSLAWAQWACGKNAMALENSRRALREGTQDARLFLHAGVIAATAGDSSEAARLLQQAKALSRMLLPSERRLLDSRLATLAANTARIAD